MDDGMFGYVKAFLPLTFRYFRIFIIDEISAVVLHRRGGVVVRASASQSVD